MAQGLSAEQVRRATQRERVAWQRHALERMAERGIGTREVLQALILGERIEDYPDTKPFPSALFLGWSGARPLHMVVAYDAESNCVFMITAYEPDLEHFEPGFRARRIL